MLRGLLLGLQISFSLFFEAVDNGSSGNICLKYPAAFSATFCAQFKFLAQVPLLLALSPS